MNTSRNWIIGIIVLAILGFVGFQFLKKEVGGINIPSQQDEITETPAGSTVPGLSIPAGFKISVFADNLPGARVIEFDQQGRILVSQTREGKISLIRDGDGDGVAEEMKTLVDGLKNPHGMAWQCATDSEVCYLYVAESDALSRFSYNSLLGTVGGKTKLADISYSVADNHYTRSLLFLPPPNENVLLISVGSSCNVCDEEDNHHAKILAYNVSTGELSEYASGLRNAVFMTMSFLDGRIFATEMGRDGLGDDVPPDEINLIEKGKNYGWPICYGKNIHDTEFDQNTYIRNPCMAPFETPSFVDLQAHSAPLGLSFVPEEGWPEEYWYNLLVAYHGSWNRSVPTGYKIVRVNMNAKGGYVGTEDFITGWLTADGKKTGRPVDIKILSGGVAYISDDGAGVIYRVTRE